MGQWGELVHTKCSLWLYKYIKGILKNLPISSPSHRNNMPKVPHYFLRHAHTRYRSSRLEVFCKKGVVRNFAKVTGKHLCQSLLFGIVEGLRPATLLKRRLWHRCFPANFVEFLRTPFLQNTCERLL